MTIFDNYTSQQPGDTLAYDQEDTMSKQAAMDDFRYHLQTIDREVGDIISNLEDVNAELLEACITAYEHIGGVFPRHNLAMHRLRNAIAKAS